MQDLGIYGELFDSGRYDSVWAMGTFMGKVLIIRPEWIDITVILVREPVGV